MKKAATFLLASILIAMQPARAQHDGEHGEHAQMDHRQMDHAQMDHSQHEGHDMTVPSPVSAPIVHETGPANAADNIWGAEAMRASRDALYREHGGAKLFWLQVDRLEYRMRSTKDGYLWDIQGVYGGDINKFWFKSEGEGSFGENPEKAEIRALYSRAIAPLWDIQAGIRQDLTGPDRSHLALGVQGLSPYMFEVDAAAFLSDKGELTARIEAEYDQRITQRLILQPRAEVNLSAQHIPEMGVGAGLESLELGLRMRFALKPEFAPYVGIEQEWKLGDTRDIARANGEDASVTNFVAGVRFWF